MAAAIAITGFECDFFCREQTKSENAAAGGGKHKK